MDSTLPSVGVGPKSQLPANKKINPMTGELVDVPDYMQEQNASRLNYFRDRANEIQQQEAAAAAAAPKALPGQQGPTMSERQKFLTELMRINPGKTPDDYKTMMELNGFPAPSSTGSYDKLALEQFKTQAQLEKLSKSNEYKMGQAANNPDLARKLAESKASGKGDSAANDQYVSALAGGQQMKNQSLQAAKLLEGLKDEYPAADMGATTLAAMNKIGKETPYLRKVNETLSAAQKMIKGEQVMGLKSFFGGLGQIRVAEISMLQDLVSGDLTATPLSTTINNLKQIPQIVDTISERANDAKQLRQQGLSDDQIRGILFNADGSFKQGGNYTLPASSGTTDQTEMDTTAPQVDQQTGVVDWDSL